LPDHVLRAAGRKSPAASFWSGIVERWQTLRTVTARTNEELAGAVTLGTSVVPGESIMRPGVSVRDHLRWGTLMRQIARRSAFLAVAGWVISSSLAAGENPATRARGGLRPSAAVSSKDRDPAHAPEWTGPPIEMAPPWVGDGAPSNDRVLKLEPPRVRILSIEAVLEQSELMPAGGVQKR
jgi:hypothetical protein